MFWKTYSIFVPPKGANTRISVCVFNCGGDPERQEWGSGKAEQRRKASGGSLVGGAVRAVGADACQHLSGLQSTTQSCPLESLQTCLALVEDSIWALCLHGSLGLYCKRRPWWGGRQCVLGVVGCHCKVRRAGMELSATAVFGISEPSRCNRACNRLKIFPLECFQVKFWDLTKFQLSRK